MVTLKSVGIGAGLITGIAGATAIVGYSTDLFHSNTQISKLLESENKYSLLSNESEQDTEGWTEAWKQYQDDTQAQEDGQDKWKIEGRKKGEKATVPAGFKSRCLEKKDTKVSNIQAQEYIDFTKYCARPKTIQEILKQSGFTPLKDDSQNSKWTERIKKYKNSNNQLPNVKIASSTSAPDFNLLKNGCEVALKLKTTEANYKETLAPAKEWCGA